MGPTLEPVPNVYHEDVKPGWLIFNGKLMVIPMIGILPFWWLYHLFSDLGFDIWTSVLAGAGPTIVAGIYVYLFINDKPPSFQQDLTNLWLYRFLEFWHILGLSEQPPELWKHGKNPKHPIL